MLPLLFPSAAGGSFPQNLSARRMAGWFGSYFSNSANGLICRDCEVNFQDKMSLTKSAAACLANLKLLAGAQERTLNEVERVLIYHFTELLGHQPKLAKHILIS
jgi:hypothetical protein